MVYQPRAGDVIALDNEKAGALVASVPLENYTATISGDPVAMFAAQDAYRTVSEAIAAAISDVPFNEYERDDKNGRRKLYAEDSKVAALLEEPHPGITPARWVEALALDFVLHDRWCAFFDYQRDGSVQLVRLPGRWTSFVKDSRGVVTGAAIYRPGQALDNPADPPLTLPLDRIAFDVGYDPLDRRISRGFAISRTLEASANELAAGAAFRAAVLANGPKVPMYVARPKDAPDWTRNGGMERFKADFAGYSAEAAGKTPVLEDGMELKAAPQIDPNNVDYRATRLAAQVEFAIAMHFPPELVGYREGNFSNIAALREYLYVDVLGGRIRAFRQALNAGFRRAGLLEPKRYVEENVAVRLQGNPELQASILQTQVGAPVRTVNEARALLNLPPVDGGDDLIVPLNVTKGGLASPTDTAPKTLAVLGPRSPLALPAGRAHVAELRAVVSAGHLAAIATRVERFDAELQAELRALGAGVAKALGDASAPPALDSVLDTVAESSRLSALILPHSYGLAEAGADAVLDLYNPERDGFTAEKMLPYLSKAAASSATLIVGGAWNRLATAVSGTDWKAETDAAIVLLGGAIATMWAHSIATASTQFGGYDAAKRSGLRSKRWVHTGGEDNPRAEHSRMNGETVGIDETFSNGLRYPGDPFGGPSENAECSCRLEYSPDEP